MGAQYLISACLCGHHCRYDGGCFDFPAFRQMVETGLAIPFCPECAGGLPVPRPPCEIIHGQVRTAAGGDCTAAYARGAMLAVEECRRLGISSAILKENSPSCGVHYIYDGTHTGHIIPGQGVTAAALEQEAITLYTEKSFSPIPHPPEQARTDAKRP